MNKKKARAAALTLLLVFLFSAVLISAEKDIPIGLKKIIDYNKRQSQNYAVKISFFVAFVAGMLGILSPCILPFLPAYFSYTFKERKNIALMTLVFSAGVTLVFVAMGITAGFIGQTTLSVLQKGWLVTIAGALLVFMGLMSILGKGFSSIIKPGRRFGNDVPGVFLFGMVFALGWTACVGPILAGILSIGAVLHNTLQSAVLLFFYSLGYLIPLILLGIFYDKYNLSEKKFMKGKMIEFSLLGKRIKVHSSNMIAGILFVLIGAVILVFQGTGEINARDFLGTRQYFYTLQRELVSWEYAGIASLALFVATAGGTAYLLYKTRKKNTKKKKEEKRKEK